MVGRADDIEPLCFDAFFRGQKSVVVIYFECDVLNPGRRVVVAVHFRLRWEFEKCEHVAHACVEEHVHVRVWLLGRRHPVFGKGA